MKLSPTLCGLPDVYRRISTYLDAISLGIASAIDRTGIQVQRKRKLLKSGRHSIAPWVLEIFIGVGFSCWQRVVSHERGCKQRWLVEAEDGHQEPGRWRTGFRAETDRERATSMYRHD